MAVPRPEQPPMILSGFTWDQYQAIAMAFTGSGVRVRFLDDEVEITPPLSDEQEERSALLRRMVESWCFHAGIRLFFRSNTSLLHSGEAGGEPAEAYCFAEKKEVPDLVVENASANGGFSPRAFYQRFEVPELWIWRHGVLEVFRWDATAGRYEVSSESTVLPGLDLRLVAECGRMHNATEALVAFRKRIGA